MPANVWTTSAHRPPARFEAWRHALNRSHLEWELEPASQPTFGARILQRTVGGVRVVDCHCDPCAGWRRRQQVRRGEVLAEGDYAYLVAANGAIAEAVAVLAFDAANATIDLARGVLDTTPQAHASGTRLIGVGEWLASEGAERAPGESVFVGAIPRTSTDQGDPVLATNGQPMVLAGRQALPYPPGRIRLNGQTEPVVVAGDLTVAWAHRDRTQQTAYLVQQDEGDIGPELGVTYTLRIRNRNGVLAHTETGLLGTTFIWTAAVAALDAGALGDRITVEISAERDGLSSWQRQVRVMDRAGYGLRWGQYWGGV